MIRRKNPFAKTRAFGKRVSENKFGNRTSKGLDGYTYHSALEAAVSNILYYRERAGELTVVKRQQHIHYYSEGVKICEYWPDFTVRLKNGEFMWVEAKGKENPDWVAKVNLWRAGGPGVLELWKGHWQRPGLADTIVPAKAGLHIRHEQVFSKLEAA